MHLPRYKELPVVHGLRCAWQVWGKGDQLGTINLLTPERKLEAVKEVKEGLSISLDLPLQFPSQPLFARDQPVCSTIAQLGPKVPLRDGIIHLNTQCGSQWDGHRHYGNHAGGCFYQGMPATQIKEGPSNLTHPRDVTEEDKALGIQNWALHGIHGRGIFVDMYRYYQEHGRTDFDPVGHSVIPLQDLKRCLEWQHVQPQIGDILVMRTGWTRAYYDATPEVEAAWRKQGLEEDHTLAGVECADEVLEWLWDNHFAAVVSDSPTFEEWPTPQGKVKLHQTIIGMFGSPIGEMFDLEAISKACHERGRYTFFFCSNPLNIIGGVASTANAAAIL